MEVAEEVVEVEVVGALWDSYGGSGGSDSGGGAGGWNGGGGMNK